MDGLDAAGNLGTVGHRLQYDKNGNRSQDEYYGNTVATSGGEIVIVGYDEDCSAIYRSAPVIYTTSFGTVTEIYRYDAQDRLLFVNRDGVQVDHREYDAANRILYAGPENLPTGYATVAACEALGINNKFTRAYRPQTNGKAERYIQSALREWVYGWTYQNSAHRTDALSRWQHHYNWHRPHSGIGGLAPMSRLPDSGNNVLTVHN